MRTSLDQHCHLKNIRHTIHLPQILAGTCAYETPFIRIPCLRSIHHQLLNKSVYD